MALLLAFATAFAIFTLIFLASQAQRVIDVADYSTGADFSGMIPGGITTPGELAFQTANYRRIPGVTAASLGYTTSAEAGDTGQIPINFKAVDANTFASTIIWTQ
jgi:hypothetical protein